MKDSLAPTLNVALPLGISSTYDTDAEALSDSVVGMLKEALPVSMKETEAEAVTDSLDPTLNVALPLGISSTYDKDAEPVSDSVV